MTGRSGHNRSGADATPGGGRTRVRGMCRAARATARLTSDDRAQAPAHAGCRRCGMRIRGVRRRWRRRRCGPPERSEGMAQPQPNGIVIGCGIGRLPTAVKELETEVQFGNAADHGAGGWRAIIVGQAQTRVVPARRAHRDSACGLSGCCLLKRVRADDHQQERQDTENASGPDHRATTRARNAATMRHHAAPIKKSQYPHKSLTEHGLIDLARPRSGHSATDCARNMRNRTRML